MRNNKKRQLSVYVYYKKIQNNSANGVKNSFNLTKPKSTTIQKPPGTYQSVSMCKKTTTSVMYSSILKIK